MDKFPMSAEARDSDYHVAIGELILTDYTRRGFMDGASKFAAGGVTAATMFESLRPHDGENGHAFTPVTATATVEVSKSKAIVADKDGGRKVVRPCVIT